MKRKGFVIMAGILFASIVAAQSRGANGGANRGANGRAGGCTSGRANVCPGREDADAGIGFCVGRIFRVDPKGAA